MAQRLSGIDILVDLRERHRGADVRLLFECAPGAAVGADILALGARLFDEHFGGEEAVEGFLVGGGGAQPPLDHFGLAGGDRGARRSEENTSELPSLMRTSYAD